MPPPPTYSPFKEPIEWPEGQIRNVTGSSDVLTDEQVFYKCAYCEWSGKETGKEIIYEHMSGNAISTFNIHSSCTHIREGMPHKEKTDIRSGQAESGGTLSADYNHVERNDKDIAVKFYTELKRLELVRARELVRDTQPGPAQPGPAQPGPAQSGPAQSRPAQPVHKVEDSYPAVPLKLDGIAWSKVIVEQVRTMVTQVLDIINTGFVWRGDTSEPNDIVAELTAVKEVLDTKLSDPLSSVQIELQKENIKKAYISIKNLIDQFKKSFIDNKGVIDNLRAEAKANLDRNKKEKADAELELSQKRTLQSDLERQIAEEKQKYRLRDIHLSEEIKQHQDIIDILNGKLNNVGISVLKYETILSTNKEEILALKSSNATLEERSIEASSQATRIEALEVEVDKCNKCIIHIIEKYVALFILFLKRHIMVLTTNKKILMRSNMDDQSIQDTKVEQMQNLNTNITSANALKIVIEGQGQSDAEKLKSIFPEAIECLKDINTQEILSPIIVELDILVKLSDESLTLWRQA